MLNMLGVACGMLLDKVCINATALLRRKSSLSYQLGNNDRPTVKGNYLIKLKFIFFAIIYNLFKSKELKQPHLILKMYSQMHHRRRLPQTNQGGISASGLGGLLVGGAYIRKGQDGYENQQNNARQAKLLRMANHPVKLALAKKQLGELIMAEANAEILAHNAGEAGFEQYIHRNLVANRKLEKRKNFPMWATNEYSYETKGMSPNAIEARVRAKANRELRDPGHVYNDRTKRYVWADSKIGRALVDAGEPIIMGEVPRAVRRRKAPVEHMAMQIPPIREYNIRDTDVPRPNLYQFGASPLSEQPIVMMPRGRGRPPNPPDYSHAMWQLD